MSSIRTSESPPIELPLGLPVRRWILLLAFVVTVATGVVWLVSVNQIGLTVSHSGLTGERVEITEGSREPLLIAIDPGRRTQGATVTLDGAAVAHPAGSGPGELLVDLSQLNLGTHQLTIEVPRPTWPSLTETMTIEVLARQEP